ncbi:MAG: serine/threonine-protein kinase [Acidobacteria bacterium]|nr:serine/threonine-protein kinase [Acidobacteriota bacterium]
MRLARGTRLGPYEILDLLGAGGMGAVYKARDTRLDRTVAVKVLLPDAAADAAHRARFEREARAISRLSHPHICALFDVGRDAPSPAPPEGGGGSPVDFLVMEHLEGETLAERLELPHGRTLPLRETLRIGAELAEALSAAHRAGIVHRDLKPGNVMLTKAGAKVLDFGVARLQAAAPAGVGESSVSTCALEPLTGTGIRLGTIPYMSPEQVEGKEADARSDLFALGVILYEMIAGRRPFQGDSAPSLAAAILERDPDPLTTVQPHAPPALEHVVSTCLAKDPEARWQSAADVARELRWIAASGTRLSAGAPGTGGARPRSWRIAVAVLAAAVVTAAAFAAGLLPGTWSAGRPAGEARLLRLSMTGAPGATLVTDMGTMAISPDGRLVVFTMVDAAGVQRLWVRPLDTAAARPLAGTENAFHPFWSPDSRFVAFFAGGKLWKAPVAGGLPEVVSTAAPNGRGGSWSPAGTIVFAPRPMGPLLRVPAGGGEAVEVIPASLGGRHVGLRYPHFLPDGRHFLFLALPGRGDEYDVFAGSLDGEPPVPVMSAGSAPVFVRPGHLIFTRRGRLLAQRFNLERLQPEGNVVQLAGETAVSFYDGCPRVSASADGVLVDGGLAPKMRLVWLDRNGRRLETVPVPADDYSSPYLSPDGRRAVVAKWVSADRADLWLVDLERAVTSRLTSDGQAGAVASWASDVNLIWSADGSRIAYVCGADDLCQLHLTGPAAPEKLTQSPGTFEYPAGWSPDGEWLAFTRLENGTQYDLWLLPARGGREPVRFLQTPFDENIASVSPDGRWVAYDSDESGTPEIFVTTFPVPGEKHRVSTAGGYRAQWSPDGRQLFVWSSAGPLGSSLGPAYVVDVQTDPAFKAGTPRRLFTPPRNVFGLSATRDLQRFLTAVPVEGWTPALQVTLNWQRAIE